MIKVSTKPKITDASLDRRGRLTLTVKLDKRLYQTVRLDIFGIEITTSVDYINMGLNMTPIRTGQRTSGVIKFYSDKSSISNRRPA